MSYTISSWDISTRYRKDFRLSTAEYMIARALHLGISENRADFVINSLTPRDLGLKAWRTPTQLMKERAVRFKELVGTGFSMRSWASRATTRMYSAKPIVSGSFDGLIQRVQWGGSGLPTPVMPAQAH